MEIVCLLNPGVFRFEGKTWLVVRVAERPLSIPGKVRATMFEAVTLSVLEFAVDDPDLDLSDPREIRYRGHTYLSTLSHLRLLCSEDGAHFRESGLPPLVGENRQEAYGIEDCRVATFQDGRFFLTYTAVSSSGYGVGLRVTRDWQTYENLGLVLPPANKDCAIFEEKVADQYVCLHRPSGVIVGGHYIWLGWSPDLRHWGGHTCLAKTRPGLWDSVRIGAGAAPIKTKEGWLVIYHGADQQHRYSLGALLLDLKDPTCVRARSAEPLMEARMPYELLGFFGNVVFTNGHVLNGNEITLYYGASDTVICSGQLTVDAILSHLMDH